MHCRLLLMNSQRWARSLEDRLEMSCRYLVDHKVPLRDPLRAAAREAKTNEL